jgi:hypothetical protein
MAQSAQIEELRRKTVVLGGCTAALAGTPSLTFMHGHFVASVLCVALELALAALAVASFVRYRKAVAARPRA